MLHATKLLPISNRTKHEQQHTLYPHQIHIWVHLWTRAIFSIHGVCKYVFSRSPAITSSPLSTTSMKPSWTLPVYWNNTWISHRCWSIGSMSLSTKSCFPGEVHLDIKDNVTTNFLESNHILRLSYLIEHRWELYHQGAFHTTFIFAISLFKALHQWSIPICLSISNTSSTKCGNLHPNLCIVCQYFFFTLKIIWFHLHKVLDTHHLNASSSMIWFTTAYSASSRGLDTFRSLSFTQLVDLSFNIMSNCAIPV